MSGVLKIRGGTTAEHATFTGQEREITVDTTKNTVVVHDGATAGGFPLAKREELTATNTSFDNTASGLAATNVQELGDELVQLIDDSTPDATETVRGMLEIATTAEAQALTADDAAITPKKLGDAMNAHVLGMGQTWQNVTASRAIGVMYTNTTGRTIQVVVEVGWLGGSSPLAGIRVDGLRVSGFAWPGSGVGDKIATLHAIVPPESIYILDSSGGLTIRDWYELR